MNREVFFVATGKTGLGHLRRCAHIAGELRRRAPALRLDLLTNAPRSRLDLVASGIFDEVIFSERDDAATRMRRLRPRTVVVDTAVIPGVHEIDANLCLVLREVREDRLHELAMENRRPWDLVLLPHPSGEWTPDAGILPRDRLEAVNWIFSPEITSPKAGVPSLRAKPEVLICSGGGGSADSAETFCRDVDRVLAQVRERVAGKLVVRQVMNRIGGSEIRCREADQVLEPFPGLASRFGHADLVISTVGYNSTLELAGTDVPVLLVPVPRKFDDQAHRARRWGPRLGRALNEGSRGAAAEWMAKTLSRRLRRKPVVLGTPGSSRAAELITEQIAERAL